MSQAIHVFPALPKEQHITVRDVINVNLALSEILLEETRLMEAMQIAKVGELQDRKLKLITLMEKYSRSMMQHPELLTTISPEDRRDLQKAGEVFRFAARANYDKLLVARAVNQAVVKCVSQEATKRSHNQTYTAAGGINQPTKIPLSFSLNQTA